jgi:hypothetical protein
MAGNLCTNDFFGFSIEVPETWHAMSKSNLAGYLRAQEGSDVFNVAPILVAFKHGDDVPETDAFDPSLIVGAERLSNVPGVRTAREYLQDVKSSPDEEGFYKEDLKGPFSCLVGGQRFYGLDGKGQLEGTTMNTRLLVSVRKDYFFVIATAWESEEDGKVLADALKTVRFR